jgi:hypothetical protein
MKIYFLLCVSANMQIALYTNMNFLSKTRFKISSRCEHEPFQIVKGKRDLEHKMLK